MKIFKKLAALLMTAIMVLQISPLTEIEFTQPTTVEAAALSTTRACVHDPSIVTANGKYYLFGSHLATVVSTDLANWSSVTTNVTTDYATIFATNGTWSANGSSSYSMSGNMWAPDVIYNETMGKWCMYMSINGDNYYSSIAMATADSIEGPYTYAGTIVYSGFVNSTQAAQTDYKTVIGSNTVASRYLSSGSWNSSYGPNAIDPCVFYDASGNLWMSYGSWFGGIFMLKLSNSTGLRDYSYTYSTTTNVSDAYFGYRISGGYGCTGEGSYIVYDEETGYYYLYVSYCGLDATDSFSGYHIRLFRSTNPYGPYTDAAGNSAICTSSSADQTTKGVKLFGNYYFSSMSGNGEYSSAGYMSGGHNSAFIDSDGQRYLIYHTRFNNGTEYHQVRVHQQFVNQDGWLVTAVYEYLGSEISESGYSTSDMVGTYEFVLSGNSATTAYTGMLTTSTVVLNSDGTITGDYTGTWSYTSGSYYCTMVIGGVTYKGVFFKQYDESSSHSEVMTFSLIGNNDQSIMGSKISSDTSYTNSSTGSSVSGLDGEYYIESVLNGLYLNVEDGASTDGTNINLWSYNGSHAQKFKLVSDGTGYYYILTASSDYASCIDVYNGLSTDGTNIEEWTYWGGDMQKFEIVEVSSGKYAIKTKVSSSASCLDVYGMASDDGTNICEWTYWGGDGQLWYLISAAGTHSTTTSSTSDTTGSSVSGLDGVYYIQSKLSGMFLNVDDGSATDGTNISQYDYNGSHAQKFKLVSDGYGYYYILTASSDYTSCIDVTNGSADNGTNIEEWTYWGGDMQKFEIVEVSTGCYAFLTKASDGASALDVYGNSTESGANIDQWSYWGGDGQLWYLYDADLSGTYYIQSCLSELYLNVENGSSTDGTNINQWDYNGSHAQTFKLVSDGDGVYHILTASSDYASCIDVTNGSADDGANIEEWTYWGGTMQQFYFVPVAPGQYAIKTVASDGASCLDVYGMSTESGANICQWTYWGGTGQLWNLVEA